MRSSLEVIILLNFYFVVPGEVSDDNEEIIYSFP